MSYLILGFIVIVFMGLIIFCYRPRVYGSDDSFVYIVAYLSVFVLFVVGLLYGYQVRYEALAEGESETVVNIISLILFFVFFIGGAFHLASGNGRPVKPGVGL